MGRGRTGPLLSQGCYAKTPITEPAELTHCRADCFQKAINPQGFFLVTLYQSEVESLGFETLSVLKVDFAKHAEAT